MSTWPPAANKRRADCRTLYRPPLLKLCALMTSKSKAGWLSEAGSGQASKVSCIDGLGYRDRPEPPASRCMMSGCSSCSATVSCFRWPSCPSLRAPVRLRARYARKLARMQRASPTRRRCAPPDNWPACLNAELWRALNGTYAREPLPPLPLALSLLLLLLLPRHDSSATSRLCAAHPRRAHGGKRPRALRKSRGQCGAAAAAGDSQSASVRRPSFTPLPQCSLCDTAALLRKMAANSASSALRGNRSPAPPAAVAGAGTFGNGHHGESATAAHVAAAAGTAASVMWV